MIVSIGLRRLGSGIFTFLISGLLTLLLLIAGCGNSANSKVQLGAQMNTETSPVKAALPAWPDVAVNMDTVNAAVTSLLGIKITASIDALRDINVEETGPGSFKVTVRYNQPGMCHVYEPVRWQASILQEYGFTLLSILFKHPQVEEVIIEAFAAQDPGINDPGQFEKLSRIVVDRDQIGDIQWGADREYTKLPLIAKEYWITPKAV